MFQLDPSKAFLGVGWSAPPSLDSKGEFALAAYEEDIRQAILIILGTNPGERVMRPDFGAGLRDLVFEPMNNATIALAQDRVERALTEWEPRIDLEEVDVTIAGNQPELGQLLINIRYVVRATNTSYNLVYPFYLTEGSGTL
jgi:phage baseplate assembly protein W